MKHKVTSKKHKLLLCFTWLSAGINIFFGGTGYAISAAQKDLFTYGINYYDAGDSCGDTPSSASAAPSNTALPANASPEGKIGQTFIVGFDAGTDKSIIEGLFSKYKLGGMYLTGTNDAAAAGFNSAFYAKLSAAAGVAITASSDEEGVVHRYSYAPGVLKPAAQMGTGAESTGQKIGEGMKANGLNTDLAPVLDLRDVGNGLTGRSFSSDPATVTTQAGAFAKGLQTSGITPIFKHFPGFDSTTNGTTDDVNGKPGIIHMKGSIAQTIAPYKDLITKYPNAGIMLSNMYIDTLDGTNPASTSSKVISYLRTTVGFKGMITTDDLAVGAVTQAAGGSLGGAVAKSLNAGATMPLFQAQSTDSAAHAEQAMQAIVDKVKASVDTLRIDKVDVQVAAFKNGSSNGANTSSNASCCAGGTQLSGSSNEAKIFNYLTQKGLSSAQAAGILGNMQTESGFMPQRLQGTDASVITPADKWQNINGGGWGLVQWTPGSKIIDPTQKAGKDPNEIIVQLDFLLGQLYGKSGDLGTTAPENSAGQDLKKQTTPEKAADSFGQYYERFQGTPGDSNFVQRAAQARAIFVKSSTGTPLPPSAATTVDAASSSCSSGGSSDISAYKNPYRDLKNIQPDRIDGGLDINGNGPIHPIGNAKIVQVSTGPDDSNNWYTTYIRYQLKDGPAAGKYVYFSEHCPPAAGTKVGAEVSPDTILCTMPGDGSSTKGGPGAFSESGWGNSSYGRSSYVEGSDYSAHTNDNGNWASNGGVNFSKLIIKLGGPKGIVSDGPSTVPLPGGFPDWK